MIMASTSTSKVVFFDLDNTLFDHNHALQSAISAVQEKYTNLRERKKEDLITNYNTVLQQTYEEYLEPSLEETMQFHAIYKTAHRVNQRAMQGSVETLVRLREHGYRLAIITNGQIEDQASKAKAIGVSHLVNRIFTSEEVGCCKPDRGIFDFAVAEFGVSPQMIHMVGDSVDEDIKGALEAGLSTIQYLPMATVVHRLLFGEEQCCSW